MVHTQKIKNAHGCEKEHKDAKLLESDEINGNQEYLKYINNTLKDALETFSCRKML